MFTNRLGFQGLLKEGTRYFQGLDEATLRNIEAVRKLGQMTHTSFGPYSMNKLIINHIDKHFVTSDAATIVNELEVEHPAARLVVLAAKMQETEFGDATNFVIILASELLGQAEHLLKQGIHSADIIKGYELALKKAQDVLQGCIAWRLAAIRDHGELGKAITACVASKHLGSEAELCHLVSTAVIRVMPPNVDAFDVDNVRVAKLVGGALSSSHVVDGMIVVRDVHGAETAKTNCKVMVMACGLEQTATEAKGTVSISTAEQLINYTKGEEAIMEEAIKEIADSGVEAIIVGGSISDIAQHYCNKYKILTLKVTSKFELKRLCRTLGAVAVVRLGPPTPEEMGRAGYIGTQEISSQKVTVIRTRDSKVATIVLRGATMNVLDELERSIDDAIYCVKSVARDPRFVPGAGATEAEVAHQITKYASTLHGLEQYGVGAFGEAMECVPRILAENAGHNTTNIIAQLCAAHQQGKKSFGVDVTATAGDRLLDAAKAQIWDHHDTKAWAMIMAVEAAVTVLRVDQIIVAKPAGGPKLPGTAGAPSRGHWDDQD